MPDIHIPELCLLLLIGASSSGKSSFARQHFAGSEVLSSDRFRAMLADDENDQSVTAEAFRLLHEVVAARLRLGRLAVVDATNVKAFARSGLVRPAREAQVECVALVFDLPVPLLLHRLAKRTDRHFGPEVVREQVNELRSSLPGIEREGLRLLYRFSTEDEIAGTQVIRDRLTCNRLDESGPFDLIGDVHGCLAELLDLLATLGYDVERCPESSDERRWNEQKQFNVSHPGGRRLIFVGDLVDRGPDIPGVLALVRDILHSGMGFCVCGNHDDKLMRALHGRPVSTSHGLQQSLIQITALEANDLASHTLRSDIADFIEQMPFHLVLDGGKLVVAHAGLPQYLHGRVSNRAKSFALFGDTTGETDSDGLPVRLPWAEKYQGDAAVIYGHTPMSQPAWINNTLCIDTGCVFGHRLTAVRYPEREIVSVKAYAIHYPLTHMATQLKI